jgi:acetyltransferase-like isoleucine patch superfamily enzyme
MFLRHALAILRARILGLIPGLWFDHIGSGTRFWGFPRFQCWGSQVTIGKGCYIGTRVFFLTGPNGRITIGNNASMNDYGFLTSLSSITIEEGVAIGEFVSIRDYDHEFDGHTPVGQTGYKSAPIVIKKGAWIGRGVVITKGVTVGAGSVVGANSVVTKDIPDHCVAVGSPARPIRDLHPEGQKYVRQENNLPENQ